jgi:hypothetical protein
MACLTQSTPQLNGTILPQSLPQQNFLQPPLQPQPQQQQQAQVIQPGAPGSNPQLNQQAGQFLAVQSLQPSGQQGLLRGQDLAMQALKSSAAGSGATSSMQTSTMVPVDGLNPGLAASKFQQPNGMTSSNYSAFNPQTMSNGAPILIRQDPPSQWAGAQSPSVLQVGLMRMVIRPICLYVW